MVLILTGTSTSDAEDPHASLRRRADYEQGAIAAAFSLIEVVTILGHHARDPLTRSHPLPGRFLPFIGLCAPSGTQPIMMPTKRAFRVFEPIHAIDLDNSAVISVALYSAVVLTSTAIP